MLFSLLRGTLSFQGAIVQIIAILIVIFLVLPFHEWAHAITAYLLGDKNIMYRGRLTLNPMSHVDPFGALCLLLFNFGWAKPVPIDTRNFKKPRLYMAICALMGPVANIIAGIFGGFIFMAVLKFCPESFFATDFGSYLIVFFEYYIQVNVTLAIFNLIPIPPLDGSKILFAFLPESIVDTIYRYSQYFFILIFILLWTGLLDVPLNFLSNGLLNFIYWLTALPFGFV